MKTKLEIHKGVHVKKSKGRGWGVFTSEDIKKGEIVEECIIPYDVLPIGSTAMQNYRYVWPNRKHYTAYCIALGFGCIYNHNEKNPNVDWDLDSEERVMTFTAIRDIKAGDELMFDYQSPVLNFETK
tara:strand:+ start:53 stop:433 length:381 start_codon:yes stop_codon:yes gene_type:complete